jgi:hypothetical protein
MNMQNEQGILEELADSQLAEVEETPEFTDDKDDQNYREEQKALLNSLSAIIYQFYELQKNLYGDVKKFSDASHELMTVYQAFKGSVKDFSLLAPELRRQIQDIIHQSVRDTLKSNETELGKKLVAAAETETAKMVESLDICVENAESTLNSYIQETQFSRYAHMGIGIMSGICMVGLFVLYMKFNPLTFMSEDDSRIYRNGIILDQAWPGLTDKEKKRIDDLAMGKIDKSSK